MCVMLSSCVPGVSVKILNALDALAAEHGVGVRLPRAASRSGLSIWPVSRRVDALTHSLKLTNMHNNMHLFLHTLQCSQSAA